MKDNHTIAGNPRNVVRWCQIAREEAELQMKLKIKNSILRFCQNYGLVSYLVGGSPIN